MTSLSRLLKFVRCLNTSLLTRRLTMVNFENRSMDNTLLTAQAVFATNEHIKHGSADASKSQINIQDYDLDYKMKLLNKQANKYGRITKFNIDDILHDIETSGTVTSLQGLYLLRCCTELINDKSPALRKQLAENIWSILKKLDVDLDVSHYNILLNIYLENEYDFSPIDFLEEMLNANVKPNKVTFQKLILQFCNQGKIKEANQIVESMNKNEIPMNEDILSSFMWGHAMNNDLDAAHKVFNDMESLKIIPTIRTYSTLMNVYAVNGDMESIREILTKCKNKDIWVPDKVLLQVIYHLSINGFTEFTDEILSMTTRGAPFIKDANKMMYKLIEKKQESVAFKIFLTLTKNTRSEAVISGNFFIDTLIKFKVPIDKSVEYCKVMTEEGIHQRSFLSAINKSVANDMYDSSIIFMKGWKEIGGQVRDHYFYPLFRAYGEIGQWKDIEKILQTMIFDFSLIPTLYTLKTHVLPYMQKSAHDALASLVCVHIPYSLAMKATLLHTLSENKIREASELINTFNINHEIVIIKYNLLHAFKNTEDAPFFVSILHSIYNAILDRRDIDKYQKENKYLAQQFIDSCIIEALDFISTNNTYLLLMLFRNLINKGLSISPETIVKVENKLKDYLTKEIKDALNIMKSGNLVPKSILKRNASVYYYIQRNYTYQDVEKLENAAKLLIVTNKKAGLKLKYDLLRFYCNNLNEKKVEELLEAEEQSNNRNAITYISIIEMYLKLQKSDKAEFWLQQCKNVYPHFKPSQCLILKLVTILIENGQIEKAQEYLTCPTVNSKEYNILYCSRKLLTAVLKLNDADLLQTFFDLLKNNHYITYIHPSLFVPFIQIHLARNDTATAMQKFEWIYKNYNETPCALELMKSFIKNSDNDLLERIKNIFEKSVGKVEMNFHLAIAYLENNDLMKVKDIIQNNCPELYEENVIYFAEKYYRNGQINYLEKLFEVLNVLNFDVERLCVLLLKSYSIQKEWKKLYNLWMKMQKEDIIPSDTFIKCLNLILKEKNDLRNDSLQKFHTAIHNSDYKTAEELLSSLPLVYKSDCYSLLCNKYSIRNIFPLAIDLWEELSKKWNLELNLDVAISILNKLVKNQDIRNIERIGSFLNEQCKYALNYRFFLNQAYLKSGSWNLLMKHWESKLKDVPLTLKSLDFHNSTVVYSLIEYPEITQRFECLAYKFYEKNIWMPIQTLWIYYFLQKNAKADEIWINYIKHKPYYLWLTVLDYSQFHKDGDTYLKVVDLIKMSAVEPNNKFLAYSKIIGGCLNLKDPKKYEYGLKCLKSAILEFPMEKFDLDLLTDLQIGLENSGISWPWSVN